MSISIRETYQGRHVLVTGTTGFLGKVWLAMALDRLDDIGRLYVLVRKKGLRGVNKRFEKIVNTSPVFKPLHEKYGAQLSELMSQRVEVVEGDISEPDFGMDAPTAQRLKQDLDLIVNCAGLVDFAPDIRTGVSSNVDGSINAVRFAADSDRAKLVHISTCYVAGNRQGRIGETIVDGYTPKGIADFDPAEELEDLRETIVRLEAEHEDPALEDVIKAEVLEQITKRDLDASNATLVRNMTHRHRQQRLKKIMQKEGERRAEIFGWPNSYTYTKSISEQLLAREAAASGVDYCVLRPAIVESSTSFPVPGWNEGFNTSGPLVYLLGTWFKHLPGKPGNAFDVVPVDMVCKGITIAGSALLRGEHKQVYQCGTSGTNPLTISRATELTGLGHRRYYKKRGDNAVERVLLANWGARVVPMNHPLAMHNVRKTAGGLSNLLRKAPGKAPVKKQAGRAADGIDKANKGLKQVERVCELFKPFVHDNNWTFETRSLSSHTITEPEFRFEPEQIVWRKYWMDVHMPGLRKWCFPQFEGKQIESYTPRHKFTLLAPATQISARAVGNT